VCDNQWISYLLFTSLDPFKYTKINLINLKKIYKFIAWNRMSKFGCYWSEVFPTFRQKSLSSPSGLINLGVVCVMIYFRQRKDLLPCQVILTKGHNSRVLIFTAARKFTPTSSILLFCSARKYDIDVEISLSKILIWALCSGFICFSQSDKIHVFVIHLPLRIQWSV
jgi:hypothetical protein